MESSSAGDVRIVSRRLVRQEPASSPAAAPEVIHLTPWDLSLLTVEHNQYGILLPPPKPRTTVSGEQLVGDLASSLARALGRFYPLAGRLTASSSESDDESSTTSPGGLVVVSLCYNGEGAELIHAVAPGVTTSDITAPLYTPPVVRSFFPLTGLLNADAVAGSGLPVLAAQVTELADGAVFVAVSLNHSVGDGTTLWHLLNTWAEINRTVSTAAGRELELATAMPALDRWVLGARPVPIPLPVAKLEDIVRRRPEHTPTRECFFSFSAESVKKLKAKANAEAMAAAGTTTTTATTATISSLQSLLAHLWRAVCRARGHAPDMETTHKLVVGLRGRLRGMPREYVGSPVTFAVARSSVGGVLGKNGLGQAAWLLNRAVASASVDEDDVAASWAGEKPVRLRRVVPRRNPARLVVSGSTRFDVYGNDFGWGRPVAVRSGAGDKVDGKVMVYEGRDGGGAMALEVCLSPEALARLVADDEFMEAVMN